MTHSKQEIQAFNKWGAEQVYPDGRVVVEIAHHVKPSISIEVAPKEYIIRDFYHDANDTDKLIDVFRPDSYFDKFANVWRYYREDIRAQGRTTHEAQIAYLMAEMNNTK